MGSGNLYAQPVNTKKTVKGNRLLRSFLAGVVLLGMPFISKAAPSFANASPQIFSVCQNSAGSDFSYLLTVNDATGAVETWFVAMAPVNGSLTGFPYVAISGGSTPALGLTYMPNASFSGSDPMTIGVANDANDTIYMVINVAVTSLPTVTFGTMPTVCAGATSATLTYSAVTNLGPTSQPFAYSGASQTWTVPPGVTTINFDVQGATGGGDNHSGAPNPGNGGRVQGTLNTSAGTTLFINVGGVGGNGSVSGATGGFNGGGAASYYFFGSGGGGGGATDIRSGGSALSNRIIVAGGGGGNGWDSPGPIAGGNGGNAIGGAGANNVGGGHAGGGTQLTGGAGAAYTGWASGQNGDNTGLNGGAGSVQGISGGGGGGYYGGGGGVWSGGGGGSSYYNTTVTSGVVETAGYNSLGNGAITFNYVVPATYSITWDGGAITAGFVNVPALTTFPATPLTIAVPAGATPNTYTGHITVSNPTCSSIDYPISVTINALPDLAATTLAPAVCNQDTASDYFQSSTPGATYTWTNDNSSIGLATSGTGNITEFTATNSGTNPVVANITVTPMAAGCPGATSAFVLTVNPTPKLSNTFPATMAICDSTQFNFLPTSATSGTTFTWSRVAISGISNAGASNIGNPAEYLYNTTNAQVSVPYLYTLDANSCAFDTTISVTVNPRPMLNNTLDTFVCDGALFNFPASATTTSTTLAWSRAAVTGISNAAMPSGVGPVNENLHDTTAAPVVVDYAYTLTYTGSSLTCTNMQTVVVTVNPTPMINSGLSAGSACNETVFGFHVTSGTTGTTLNWNRADVIGIANTAGSGTGDITDSLNNYTTAPVVVAYTYTLAANGCSNNQNVTVTINPSPKLNSALSPSVCDSAVFTYTPTSATTGTTYTWTRDTVTGISNPVGVSSGIGDISETLINTTPNPVVTSYIYMLSANGCPANVQTVNLTVNPRPLLSTTLTPPQVCDSSLFHYVPASLTGGTAFAWYRPYIPGIHSLQQFGTGTPDQYMKNSTNVPVEVPYMYTLTANGCVDSQTVTVLVNPTPTMNPPFSRVTCSGYPFMYTPTSYTAGATYAWDRPTVANILPGTAFASNGPGLIDEKLYNGLSTPITVTYVYRLGINGCINLGTQNLTVVVDPTPAEAPIVTFPTIIPCAGTKFMNFGIASVPANVDYTWSATNATVYASGSQGQYALIDFNNSGAATVTITGNYNGYASCTSSSTYTVTVNSSEAAQPRVIYLNGQFICLENDNGSYQWGYDNSKTLASTTLTGQTQQDYINTDPQWGTYNYWVMTGKDGCEQKTYYNAPTGVTDVNDVVNVKVYPNPTQDNVNVEINTTVEGKMQVEILNLMGQKVMTQPVVNNKATIGVAALPAGCYIVDCFRDGVKINSTKFIKN